MNIIIPEQISCEEFVPGFSFMTLALELLHIALSLRDRLSAIPTDREWERCFAFARKQAIVGVMWNGIERLSKEESTLGNEQSVLSKGESPLGKEQMAPYRELLKKWLWKASKIQKKNAVVDGACKKAIAFYEERGCDAAIIKGQAVAQYYKVTLPSGKVLNLSSYRNPGDVDVWGVLHGRSLRDSRREMIKIAGKDVPGAVPQPHHIDSPDMDGIHVEVHFTPTEVCNPWYNRRVQRYFEASLPRCENHHLPLDVDIVFQLMHLRKHVLDEGVGLRQVMDLYFTMKEAKEKNVRIKESLLSYLGLHSFAAAMMWVLHKVFLMQEEELLCSPDKRRGRFILSEIMKGGNFGAYNKAKGSSGTTKLQHLWYYIRLSVKRGRYFPGEALCTPWYRLYVAWWSKRAIKNL